MLSSLIGQCPEKPLLQPAQEAIPEEMVQGYLNGRISGINNGQALLNGFADRKMKAGFDMLKEYLWRLWDQTRFPEADRRNGCKKKEIMPMLQEYITQLYAYQNKMPQIIGHLSMENLKHFLDGTLFALNLCGHQDAVSALTRPWWDYVYLYYGIHPYETTVGWHTVIREHAENEEEAIRMFFILLKKYLSEYYPDLAVPE